MGIPFMKHHATTAPQSPIPRIPSKEKLQFAPLYAPQGGVGVAKQTVRCDVLGVATCTVALIIMAGQLTLGTEVIRTSEQPWQSIERSTVTVDE